MACYYRFYGSYGGNTKTAVRALRRRMPAKTAAECEVAFQRALLLVDRCRVLMDADYRQPMGRGDGWEDYDMAHLIGAAKPDFQEFSDQTIHGVLKFALLNDHLR